MKMVPKRASLFSSLETFLSVSLTVGVFFLFRMMVRISTTASYIIRVIDRGVILVIGKGSMEVFAFTRMGLYGTKSRCLDLPFIPANNLPFLFFLLPNRKSGE